MGGFEPGGGAANILNPPFIVTASQAALPSCSQGTYCGSQYAFGNTLESGLGQFMGPGGVANHAAFPQVSEEDPTYAHAVHRQLQPEPAAGAYVHHHIDAELRGQRRTPPGDEHRPQPAAGDYRRRPAGATGSRSFRIWVGTLICSGQAQARTTRCRHRFRSATATGCPSWPPIPGPTRSLTPAICWAETSGTSRPCIIPIIKEWTQSGYDVRDRAVINVDYDLPFGVGKSFVNHPGFLDMIVGGWKTDMEWWGQTGQPFTVGINRVSGWGNANGGTANSARKIADPFATGLPAPNVNGRSEQYRAASPTGRRRIQPRMFARRRPGQGRAGTTRAPLPTRSAS